MNTSAIKVRLSILNFLEFAVWGAYLTCMGNYLGKAGMGAEISWFYAIQGIVSIFMPTIIGIIADKFVQPQRLMGICHLIAGAAMIALCVLGLQSATPDKATFIAIYTISVAFYMPTLALSNTVAFTILKDHGLDTVKDFPPIRVLGTVGFIITMWFVNCATFHDGSFGFTLEHDDFKFQYTCMQFLVSGVLSVVLFLYSFTLPQCKIVAKPKQSLAEQFGINAFKLFKQRKMAMFFIFSMLLGMSLQVTNGFATPFLTSFTASADPEVASSFAATNATMLVSLSQISEALCILLIPFFLKRFGIKAVMLIAMVGWVLRFGFFGVGSPTFPGVTLFILSCIVYGVAFDFFNVSGGLYVDQECDTSVRASAQGLFMLMTNGLGATIGTLSAGAVVNHYCQWVDGALVGDWTTTWLIFAGYAAVVAILFLLFFKSPKAQKA
jgi:NHS family nucleoside permease-like MFS transporter